MPDLLNAKMNKQNLNIATQSQNTMLALQKLIYKGITVLSINIGESQPVIEVLNTAHCNKLNSILSSTIGTGSGRKHLKVTVLNDCIVRWETDSTLH